MLLFSQELGLSRSEEAVNYPDAKVERVIEIEDGGAVVTHDRVTLSSDVAQQVRPLEEFQIGFHFEYRKSLAYFSVHDALGTLNATLDASAGGAEFSWANVAFREPVDVSGGGSYDFTLICVFSGLVEPNQTRFRVVFPAYPSLDVEADLCNVTVMLPTGATLDSGSPGFLNRTLDSRWVLYNETSPLGAYMSVSSWAEFTALDYQLLEVDEWRREIEIDGFGELGATDFYQLVNKGDRKVSSISFVLPPNATDVSVQDIYGTYAQSSVSVNDHEDYVELRASLREDLQSQERLKLLIVYKLDFWQYVAQKGWQDYVANISLIGPERRVMKRSAVTVSLPEGAEFQLSSMAPQQLGKEGFTVKVEFAEDNMTRFHESSINLEYQYLVLWSSFRPTLWVGTAVAILGGVFFIRKVSRPEAIAVTPVSSEVVRKFVDSYEAKRRLRSRLESLERQVQRGKISRRRYRLRRSSLDGRLSRLQKDLTGLRSRIEAASSRHAEWMRQLETAEAEIETLDRDIGRVEVRYRRREISAEARRRLLDEYNRIKERAENRIGEILLRLREEIR